MLRRWSLMEPHPSSPIKSEWPEEVKAFWIPTVLSTVQARDARHSIPSRGQISEHGRSMSKGGPAGRKSRLDALASYVDNTVVYGILSHKLFGISAKTHFCE